MKKNNVNYSQLVLLTAGIALIVVLISMISFTPTFAHDTDDTLKKKQTQTTIKKKTVTIDNTGKRTEKVEGTNNIPDETEETTSDFNISIKKDKSTANGNMVLSVTADGGDGKKTTKSITINTDDILNEVATAMATVKNELSAIDWSEIGDEIEKGLREAEKEMKAAGKEIELAEISKELAVNVKKELHRAKAEMERSKHEAQKANHIAKEQRISAQVSISEGDEEVAPEDFGTMLKNMEADGLIDRKKKYSVEKENGKLYINGEKQSDKVLNKYKNYLKADNILIKGSKGSLNVSIND